MVSVKGWIWSLSRGGYGQCQGVDTVSVKGWIRSVSRGGYGQCQGVDTVSVKGWIWSVSRGGYGQCQGVDTVSVKDSSFGDCRCLGGIVLKFVGVKVNSDGNCRRQVQ